MTFTWYPGVPGCRSRRQPVAGVVWHHTAGENHAASVVRTLKSRNPPGGLSIHYVIDYDGTITQCADPATTVCYHAGSRANERFIGVEIVNRALPPATAKHPRPIVKGHAHGRTFDVLDFTPAQYASVLTLADALSNIFNIPRVTAPGDTVIDVRKFSGHVEHCHVSKRKFDSSTLVMQYLRAHGYA